jgi:hypothetical protein
VAQAPETYAQHSDPDGCHTPPDARPPDPDLLSAVVLHTLVRAGPGGTTLLRTIDACERDPLRAAERAEIERALAGLISDGLAYRRSGRVGATRAALRADALSF